MYLHGGARGRVDGTDVDVTNDRGMETSTGALVGTCTGDADADGFWQHRAVAASARAAESAGAMYLGVYQGTPLIRVLSRASTLTSTW